MARRYYILLLDDRYDLQHLGNILLDNYQAVFCLFWTAPSTKAKLQAIKAPPFFGLQDIISTDMAWGEEAHRIAREVIDAGPRYDDLPVRSYLAEPLYKESHLPGLLDKLIEVAGLLRDQENCEQVVFEGQLKKTHSDLLMRKLSNKQGYLFNQTLPRGQVVSSSPGSSHAASPTWLHHLRKIWVIRDWRVQAMHLLERLDKTCRYRGSFGPLFPRSTITKGGVTFFSSYLNNSRILSSFADLMPSPITWIATNIWARQGISESRDQTFWLWQFSGELPPSHMGKDTLPPAKITGDAPDYSYLMSTVTWKNWERVESRLLMNLTRSWEAYLSEAEPRLIVVANQWGIEGWFTQLAKKKGIPVLQVMHGVLGGYLYTQTPIISDALIVPGEFWKNLWPEAQRDKILAYSPPDSFPIKKRSHRTTPGTLTYFSWPLASVPHYNFSELTDAVITILHNLLSTVEIQIMVRPHPLENPLDFLGRWRHLYGPLPAQVKFDGNNTLTETLRQTDLALMFRSTVMLDCLAQGIPVVMPGWVDYGWNAGLMEISGLYLAEDVIDLKEKILSWLQQPPDFSGGAVQKLVSPPGEGQDKLRFLIEKLLSRNEYLNNHSLFS
jgi:hypothetical protein